MRPIEEICMEFFYRQSAFFRKSKLIDLSGYSIRAISKVLQIGVEITNVHVAEIQPFADRFLRIIIKADIIIAEADLPQYCSPTLVDLWFSNQRIQLLNSIYNGRFYGLRFRQSKRCACV